MPSYNRQFRGGYVPQEPISPLGPIYREAAPPFPEAIKRRQGIALGNQMEARPGMAGKQGRTHKLRKR